MTFLNPLALMYALFIGVLLFLHFRKPRKTHWVPDIRLWQDIEPESMQRKSVFRIVKRNRLLIYQILFIAAVTLALARPLVTFWGESSRTLLLVLDCSASMNARENGVSRFDLAREKARSLISDARGADKIVLVQARPRMRLDAYTGSEKAAIGRALETMTATDAPVDASRAAAAALSSLENAGPVETYIITDGARESADPAAPPWENIRRIWVGKTGDNVGITRLSVRENPFSGHDRQIFCEIENFSDQVHEFPFEISLDGAVLKSETIRLHSKQRERAVTDVPAGSYGIIRAAIRAEDSLEIDNEACAILEQHGIRVLLGTAGNTFLQKALEANPRIALTVLDPEACTTEELDKGYDIIVLDGFEPPRLPPANYLLIRSGPGRSIGRGSLRGEPREPVFTRPDHPVLAFLDPGDFTIDRAAGPDLSPADTVLIEGNGLPLLAANEIGVHRTVKLRFDIRDSGLALTYAFPVLVSNILSWLDSGNAGAGNQAAAGSAIRLRLPGYDPSKDLVVETPDGGTYSTKADKGVVTIAETERAGVYNVRQDRTVERFVVNLSSKAESDIKPADTLSDDNPRTTDRAATAGAGRGIWRWLLLASLILLVLEWRRYQGTAL